MSHYISISTICIADDCPIQVLQCTIFIMKSRCTVNCTALLYHIIEQNRRFSCNYLLQETCMCKCTNPTRLTPPPPSPPNASSYQRSDLQIKILQSFNYRFDYDRVYCIAVQLGNPPFFSLVYLQKPYEGRPNI